MNTIVAIHVQMDDINQIINLLQFQYRYKWSEWRTENMKRNRLIFN